MQSHGSVITAGVTMAQQFFYDILYLHWANKVTNSLIWKTFNGLHIANIRGYVTIFLFNT